MGDDGYGLYITQNAYTGTAIFTGSIANSAAVRAEYTAVLIQKNGISGFSGGITNSGAITSAEDAGVAIVDVGDAGTFSGGNISNSGAISSLAYGLYVYYSGVDGFTGNISNSGAITTGFELAFILKRSPMMATSPATSTTAAPSRPWVTRAMAFTLRRSPTPARQSSPAASSTAVRSLPTMTASTSTMLAPPAFPAASPTLAPSSRLSVTGLRSTPSPPPALFPAATSATAAPSHPSRTAFISPVWLLQLRRQHQQQRRDHRDLRTRRRHRRGRL